MKRKIISLIIASILYVPLLSFAQTEYWTRLNGPNRGTITSLAIHPTGSIFAIINRKAVWRSTNDGQSWQQLDITNQMTTPLVSDIIIHKNTGALFIYVDDDTPNYSNPAIGLYKSTDNGISWRKYTSKMKEAMFSYVIDYQRNILYAFEEAGIYKISLSNDNYAEPVNLGTPTMDAHPPADMNIQKNLLFFGDVESYGLRKFNLNTGTKYIIWSEDTPSGVCVDNNRSLLYLAIPNMGVYLSYDDGSQWSALNDGLNYFNTSALIYNEKSQTVYLGTKGGGVFVLKNYSSWYSIKNGLSNYSIAKISYSPNTGVVFAATADGYVYRLGQPSGSLTIPSLLYPYANNTQTWHTVNMHWSSVTGADGYTLQVSRNSSFSDLIINESGLTATYYLALAKFEKNRTYYWRVRAKQGANLTSDWAQRSFITDYDDLVTALNPNNYEVAALSNNQYYYIDREKTITSMPSQLQNLTWIKTANTDKGATANSFITLSISKPANVFICYDNRGTSQPPDWLKNFTRQSYSLGVDDEAVTMSVWMKHFSAGPVALGGNLASGASGAKSNYIVAIQPDDGGVPGDKPVLLYPRNGADSVWTSLNFKWSEKTGATYDIQVSLSPTFSSTIHSVSSINKPAINLYNLELGQTYYWRVRYANAAVWSDFAVFTTMTDPPLANLQPINYELAFLKLNDEYYIDSSFPLKSIPAPLQNLVWMKTANADKQNNSASFITFDLLKPSTVYIAYDRRATSIPTWLKKFAKTGMEIAFYDQSNPTYRFDVYEKHFSPGEVALGGNNAPYPDKAPNTYLVLFKPDQEISISGRVVKTNGQGLNDVIITYAGAQSGTVKTAGGGYYSFKVFAGWTGTVALSYENYSFLPDGSSYATPVNGDLSNKDYTALPPPDVHISGRVTLMDGTGLDGVLVYAAYETVIATSTTSGGGFYTLSVPYEWSGFILLEFQDYIFSPDRFYSEIKSDSTEQDFIAMQCDDLHWQKIQSTPPQLSAFTIVTDRANRIYLGGENGLAYRSTDNGNSWTRIANGLTDYTIGMLATDKLNNLFLHDGAERLFKSSDNGASWQRVGAEMANMPLYDFAFNSKNHLFIIAGQKVFRSLNNGDTWVELSTGLTELSALAIDASDYIFLGTDNGRIARSTNNGLSWQDVSNGLDGTAINKIACHPSGSIFAGTRGKGIYRTTANATNWNYAGLKDDYITAMCFNSIGHIFVGISAESSSDGDGIYRSTDNGATWICTGLKDTYFTYEVAITPSGFLYAAVSPFDVFRTNESTAPIDSLHISGKVTLANGAALAGVTLSFSGGAGATVTAADGSYHQIVPYGWTGVITPSFDGYSFKEKTLSFQQPLYENKSDQNFIATPPGPILIAGEVFLQETGAGLNGVNMVFSDGKTVTTVNGGKYIREVSYGWSGTVTPQLTDFRFQPPFIKYPGLKRDTLGQNYFAIPAPVLLSGTVYSEFEQINVPNVSITFSDGWATKTDANGHFERTISSGWKGTITPSHADYNFDPAQVKLEGPYGDKPAIKINAVPNKPISIRVARDTLINGNDGMYKAEEYELQKGVNKNKKYLLVPDYSKLDYSNYLGNFMSVRNLTNYSLRIKSYVEILILDKNGNILERRIRPNSPTNSLSGKFKNQTALLPQAVGYLGNHIDYWYDEREYPKRFFERFRRISYIVEESTGAILYKREHSIMEGTVIYLVDPIIMPNRRTSVIANLENSWYEVYGLDDFEIVQQKVSQAFTQFSDQMGDLGDWLLKMQYLNSTKGLSFWPNIYSITKVLHGQMSITEFFKEYARDLFFELAKMPLGKLSHLSAEELDYMEMVASQSARIYGQLENKPTGQNSYSSKNTQSLSVHCPVDFHITNRETGGQLYYQQGIGLVNTLQQDEALYSRFMDGSKQIELFSSSPETYQISLAPESGAPGNNVYTLNVANYTASGERAYSRFENVPIYPNQRDVVVLNSSTPVVSLLKDNDGDGREENIVKPQNHTVSLRAPDSISVSELGSSVTLNWKPVEQADNYLLNYRVNALYDSTLYPTVELYNPDAGAASSNCSIARENPEAYLYVSLAAKNDSSCSAPRGICIFPDAIPGQFHFPGNYPMPILQLDMDYLTWQAGQDGSFLINGVPTFTQPLVPRVIDTAPTLWPECINAQDAFQLLANIANGNTWTAPEKQIADANEDGRITKADASAILQYCVSTTQSGPAGNIVFDPPAVVIKMAEKPRQLTFSGRAIGDVLDTSGPDPAAALSKLRLLVPETTLNVPYCLDLILMGNADSPVHSLDFTIDLAKYGAMLDQLVWNVNELNDWIQANNHNPSQSVRISTCGLTPIITEKQLYRFIFSGPIEDIKNVVIQNLFLNGHRISTASVVLETAQPNSHLSISSYPNPFNSELKIHVSLPQIEKKQVTVTVYDVLGKQVDVLYQDIPAHNEFDVYWNGANSAGQKIVSGVYIINMTYGNHLKNTKAIMIK